MRRAVAALAVRVDPPTHLALEVKGRTVALLRGGAGDPLLYLHGVCADLWSSFPGTTWTPFLARLAAAFDVVAPALPGYDVSGGLESFDEVEDYVFHLEDLLDELVLGPVHVVGHSLGGWLAAELALRRPAMVRRLVLVDPLGLHVPGVAVPPFFAAVAPRGLGGFAEPRRLLFADPEGDAALAALPDGMEREQQLRWFGGLAGAARLGWRAPQFQSHKLARRLDRISVPALVVRGEQDLLVPEEHARAWVAGLPSATLVEVPDAGHCLPAEWPEVVAAEVVAFLAGTGPGDPAGED